MNILFLILTVSSVVYWILAWLVMRRFFRNPHVLPTYTPPVSLLKPVKGVDAGAYENFASFCRQDYPSLEILFGVADPTDPAVPLIERLQREFPLVRIRLVHAPPRGTNRKVSILHALAREAQSEILVVSDSDMRVTPDYLRRVVAPMGDPKVGIVTCPYRGADPITFTARLEALYMGATFLPSCIFAHRALNVTFALGATMVVRGSELLRIGGFEAFSDYLADDYQLAARIVALGRRIHVANYVVASMLGATSFRDQWDREIRWARCNRLNEPRGYAGLCLAYTTPLALAMLVTMGFSGAAWLLCAGALGLRTALAWDCTRQSGDVAARQWLLLLPLREMLNALIWLAGGIGRSVTWRGIAFRVIEDGRLQEVSRMEPMNRRTKPPLHTTRPGALRPIRRIDSILRAAYGIEEYSQDRDCIFRIRTIPAPRMLRLADGEIPAGVQLLEIHLWNERMPQIPPGGANLAWGKRFRMLMDNGFRHLARNIERDPSLRDVRAIGGTSLLMTAQRSAGTARLWERYGFELNSAPELSWLLNVADRFYGWLLLIEFQQVHPTLREMFRFPRRDSWISRAEFLKRYGTQAEEFAVSRVPQPPLVERERAPADESGLRPSF